VPMRAIRRLRPERRALLDAKNEFSRARLRLLTQNADGLPHDVPDGIVAEPVYAWQLRE
jgi:hypothetical protein